MWKQVWECQSQWEKGKKKWREWVREKWSKERERKSSIVWRQRNRRSKSCSLIHIRSEQRLNHKYEKPPPPWNKRKEKKNSKRKQVKISKSEKLTPLEWSNQHGDKCFRFSLQCFCCETCFLVPRGKAIRYLYLHAASLAPNKIWQQLHAADSFTLTSVNTYIV